MAHSYLPYEEPGITTILSLTSLLLLLNIIRYILDRLLYSGIIGEILIGIIWGLPVGGTSWLSLGTQETIQAFGYLGLIGLVFEGGLCTDPAQLRNSLFLSISVATIGLCLPIALSFALLGFPFPVAGSAEVSFPTALAAFSAGASLCSTSLGTTFAILSSAGMQKSRTGTVLIGAAMMDDVVGLVMVNIVTTLGAGNTEPWPIARPIVASFGLLIVTLLLVPYLFQPMWKSVRKFYVEGPQEKSPARPKAQLKDVILRPLYNIPHLEFLLSTFVLVAFVTIAYFIDASVLFAAFIAGGVITNLRDLEHRQTDKESPEGWVYDIYYKPVMDFVLVPFFFVRLEQIFVHCPSIFIH
jgi:Kef-type K+ transport system membrane component KefB